MPTYSPTFTVKEFKGLHNKTRNERIPKGFLSKIENFDIDNSYGLSLRQGYEKLASGRYSNLFFSQDTFFATINTDLHVIDQNGNSIALIEENIIDDFGNNTIVSYFEYDGYIYYSSLSKSGRYKDNSKTPWFISNPQNTLNITPGNGILEPGTYQITFTVVLVDGRESGAAEVSYFSTNSGGIVVNNFPDMSLDTNFSHFNLYCSVANGSTLYYVGSVISAVSTFSIGNTNNLVIPIQTLNSSPMILSNITGVFHGCTYSVEGNTLFYSEPYSPHLYNYTENFIVFEEEITGVFPVEGGVWVSAGKMYYIQGKSFADGYLSEKDTMVVVKGTGVKIPGSVIFINNTPIGYKWIVHTNKGVCVLFDDGIVLNLTSSNVEYPKFKNGVGLFTQIDGFNKYLAINSNPTPQFNTKMSDTFSGTIIRNGVTI